MIYILHIICIKMINGIPTLPVTFVGTLTVTTSRLSWTLWSTKKMMSGSSSGKGSPGRMEWGAVAKDPMEFWGDRRWFCFSTMELSGTFRNFVDVVINDDFGIMWIVFRICFSLVSNGLDDKFPVPDTSDERGTSITTCPQWRSHHCREWIRWVDRDDDAWRRWRWRFNLFLNILLMAEIRR